MHKILKLFLVTTCIFLAIGNIKITTAPVKWVDTLEFFHSHQDVFVYFCESTSTECISFQKSLEAAVKESREQDWNFRVFYVNTAYWKGSAEGKKLLAEYEVDTVPKLIYLDKEQGTLEYDVLKLSDEELSDLFQSKLPTSIFYNSEKDLYQILFVNLLILCFFLLQGKRISHGMLLLVLSQFVLTRMCMEVYFNNLLAVSQEVYNDSPEIYRLFLYNLGTAAISFLYFFIRLMINSFGREKGDTESC